jgi:UTP--glucose-1-phosphate uridylyltransferase
VKVVIPAAGRGTRFLPITRAQPKEMLPVVNRPVIQYAVEEAITGGADEVLVITGPTKRAVEDYFREGIPVEGPLRHSGPDGRPTDTSHVRLRFATQVEPRGLAEAIRIAQDFTADESFGVLLGDTIHCCPRPVLRQLWERHDQLSSSVVSVETVSAAKVSSYGIVEGIEVSSGLYRCSRLLEKPAPSETDSRLGMTGAYLLTPRIYPAIDRTPPGRNGETQLTDALQSLCATEPVFASKLLGKRFDIGDPDGWLKANLELAYREPKYRAALQAVIEQLLSRD